jgi:hypothetical protein
MYSQQCSKILEIRDALIAQGFVSLDEQAGALGLSRSTTWSLLKANYKRTGLSASVIKRMLASNSLPALVRCKLSEYIDEKAAGAYGHNGKQRHRFINQLPHVWTNGFRRPDQAA